MRRERLAGAAWLADPAVQRVLGVLGAADARVVGGAVRNTLMGLPVTDTDIATTLVPDEVMRRAAAAGLGVHPTGLEHGTVTLTVRDGDGPPKAFEVTTLRRDVATDGRRAVVAYTTDWAEDAARRDFTINALYCDGDGRVYDPLGGGADDVAARRVRFVGEPEARIREDYLRILRLFRFHAQYASGPIDAAALAAAAVLKDGLAGLSRERVREETLRLVAAPGAVPALEEMNQASIAKALFGNDFDVAALSAFAAVETAADLTPDALLRIRCALPMTAGDLHQSLRLSNAEARRLAAADAAPPPVPALREAERRAVLYRLGAQTWRDAVRLAWARQGAGGDEAAWLDLLRLPERWSAPAMPVSGDDLVAAGVAPGPALGELLHRLEDRWIASDFTATRAELMRRADLDSPNHRKAGDLQ